MKKSRMSMKSKMLFFRMKYSETLIAILKILNSHWQSVGHTAAKCSLVSAEQAASTMQAKQVMVELGALEQMNTEDRKGEGGRARARLQVEY